MKKQILFIITLIVLSLISCRKERTCECKTTNTDVRSGFLSGTDQTTSSTKETKVRQKKKTFQYTSNCFSNKGTYTTYGGGGSASYTIVSTYEKTCELK